MENAAKHEKCIVIDGYGPIPVDEDGQLTYGEMIRHVRKKYGISAEQVAVWYGEIARGGPVTERHIQRMEQTDTFFPGEPDRRWILAQLLSVPPALMALVREKLSEPSEQSDVQKELLGISWLQSIDSKEYYQTLKNYWADGLRYTKGTIKAISDIRRRIARLQREVLYPSTTDSKQQAKMARLLCGYWIVLAEIAREHECYQAAKDWLTYVYRLASEKKLCDFQGIVLVRRRILFFSTGFDPAFGDFETGEELRTRIAPQIQGRLLSVNSISQAHLAQDKRAFNAALFIAYDAEKLVESITSEDFLFFTYLDRGRYLLDRAVMWVESLSEELRRPDKAQQFLDLAIEENMVRGRKGKSVQAYRQLDYDLVQARIYCDQGYHPPAIVTAEQVLKTLDKIQSKVGLYKVAALINDIRKRAPYGEEVISLEQNLMKLQYSHVYHR